MGNCCYQYPHQKLKSNEAQVLETIINKDFFKWVFSAFVVATPIAWFGMNNWLENFAYKTELSW